MRSLMRNSARSSERLSIAAMTRILNIITGSNAAVCPARRRNNESRDEIHAEHLKIHGAENAPDDRQARSGA